MKRKLIILTLVAITVLAGTGGVFALNGYFGGGGDGPDIQLDTSTRGLVGYWNFEEGSGSLATDASGNGNTGTLRNMATSTNGGWLTATGTTAQRAGLGSALEFDGVDDYVSMNPTVPTGDFT